MQRTSPSTISLHNLGRQMSITTGGVIVWGSLLVPLLFMTASCQLSPQPDTQVAPTDTTICESKDIRNSVEMFAELRGCRVVEGFVQIVLIDSADFSEFANISFPELREITDFLLLYRVRGLHSIGKIFPNLSVIRGNTIFLNYALVVYEMLHLQEIGLTSLTNILRGGVYITKNPLLCFVDTIDWNAIARQGHDTHYISTNKALNECPLCPTNNQSCSNSMKTGKPLCWNSHHCQKVCPEKCAGSCSPTGECCDSSCLGGCHGSGSENCFACKDVWYDNRCISTCPDKTYEYLNWRCLQESECYDMPKPHDSSKKLSAYPWKPFKDKCLLHCPPGHLDVETTLRGIKRYQCRLCEGVCKRKCTGANIDSIAAAQKLKGCTSITGALEIQIRGGSNVVKELEENLNMIEEIDHYLKIVRSFPLISLNFLRNLREIHGHSLESSKYALIVLDNQNLLDLWDWEHRGTNFKINNGKLFFHFNPKLCLSKIDKLREISNLANYTDLEVASNSNGDKVACNIKTINARVENTNSKGALILWEAFQHYDSRTLLGYVIYSIEAPYRNVTMYDGRDACGGDGWEAHDVPVPESSDIVKHNLTDLDSYTQYAFYVKTYTIATEKSGAQSPIIYFRTKPDIPSEPMRTTIFSKSSNELVINWSPPLHPNGNVTHYIIVGRWEEYNEDLKEQAKYCNKTAYPSYDPNFVPPKDDKLNSKPEKPQTDSTCSCKQHFADNKAREIEISFEDQLQNRIYVKRMDRKKRDTSSYPKITDDSFNCNDDGQNIDFCRVVYNTTLMVNNLRHFSRYIIDVRACREWEPDENQTEAKNCSAAALISGSTLALDNANDIESQSLVWDVSNKTAGDVLLKWAEPPQPNGLIMAYHIIYKRNDIENYQPITRCITKIEFCKFGNSYTLQKLSPGNYSICVKATSNSGTGKCTDEKYFYIEEVSSAPLLYIAICAFLGMFTILGVLFAMVLKLRRKYSKIPRKRHLIATVNPEYVPTVYEPDDWEVPRSRVELLKEIGQGSFGMVYEGIFQNVVDESTEQRCAVKTVNIQAADRDRIEFLNEASVMKAFNTHHVVKLLGVVSRDQPTLVIMELMANGDLKSYLRSHRPDSTENPHAPPPPLKRILRMAAEIADGMAYLSAKKFVHRDLAARNCMVSDDLTVKIGDFGMTRDIYETEYYRKGSKGLLPVRWMAPESLKDGVFTSHSDAWSYGIVLYEMVTLASQPYQGLSNEQVLRYVMDGGLIDRPDNCPDKLYHVMRLCWQQKPNSRPTFLELVSLLHQDVGSDFQDVSFYDSDEGIELRGVLGGEDTPLSITRDIEDFSLSDDDDYKQPRSSNSSKISNGSTTPNGYIIPHQAVKTTKC